MSEKRIELVKIRCGDVKTTFGNPRKISKKKLDELKDSLVASGDFGIFIIDENNDVIGGNQRLKAVMDLYGPDHMIDCKRLIGYTKAEKRAINLKDNTHSGEWDMEALANWTADLSIDTGIQDMLKQEAESRKIKEMELIHYEKYNYVLIVCKNTIDYDELVDKLGIRGGKVHVTNKRTIQGRAVWYDKVKSILFKPATK